jgi:putative transposase
VQLVTCAPCVVEESRGPRRRGCSRDGIWHRRVVPVRWRGDGLYIDGGVVRRLAVLVDLDRTALGLTGLGLKAAAPWAVGFLLAGAVVVGIWVSLDFPGVDNVTEGARLRRLGARPGLGEDSPGLKGTSSLTRRPDQRDVASRGHAVRSPLRVAPPRDRARSSECGSRTEIEVVVLRHQVKVLSRKVGRPKLRRIDKAFLAACSRVVPKHRWGSFIVAPSTLLRWHRELVRRKWTYKPKRVGRRPIEPALATLICRMGRDTPRWSYMRIKGECRKLGMSVAATTVKKALRAAGLEPAPRRDGPSWSEFLRAQADGILACDFFTVETVCLRTLSVLFFIEVGSRRLHMTSSTRNPSGEFVAHQARNLSMDGELEEVTFLIRDRDSTYTRAFDEVFTSKGARVIKTPVRAPKGNAFAERFVRSVRPRGLGSHARARQTTPGPDPSALRGALQRPAPPPRSGSSNSSRSVRAADLTRRATRSPDRCPRWPDPRI